ncbi:MAG: diaminobutyrate--2-oxoglutarate transaminase [Deltaproteobacteria bacterium]|nr:MAG: diaminobutyrate--2-oxoglutarate transaminase [Deltaproteobacteria bacterium]
MTSAITFSKLESEVRSYSRAFPTILETARGTELWDSQGRRYLDFLAGAGSLNYGHNNPIIKQALLDYIMSDAITHSLDLQTVAKERFLRVFNELLLEPRGLDYVLQFTGPTGTNSVEAAFKIARKVTGRTTIVNFTNGFHGVSMGALALTCNSYHRAGAGIPLMGSFTVPYDGYFGPHVDTMDYFEKMIEDPSSGLDHPAAVVVETVQGEGGLNAASMEWLQRLRAITEKHGIVLIIDDIQSGCGRTGTFFSFEPADIKPDIVTLSKSISGFGLPFALVLIKRDLDKWKPGEHNGTFRGNNHAFVTAATALETYWSNDDFAASVRAKGEHLGKRLQEMVDRFDSHIVEVRGRGMMRGIRLVDPDRAANVSKRAFEMGLIIERSGPHDEVIKCLMPLTIPDAHLDEGLDILSNALAAEFAEGAA